MRRVVSAVLVASVALAACSWDDGDDPLEPEPTTTTEAPRGLLDAFFPVIAEAPPPCPDDPGAVLSRAGDLCYVLEFTFVVPVRDVVESAEPVIGQSGQWEVRLTLTPPGIDRFNRLAELCFRRDAAQCPTGQLAVTAGGEVVSAPTIQNESFERDQITVTGNFDRDEAGELAEAFQP